MTRVCLVAVLALVCTSAIVSKADAADPPDVSKQHRFLKNFVGNWEAEGEIYAVEPGKPPVKMKSTMSGHMLGDFWAIAVVKGEAFGTPYQGQGTFGYDSRKKKYVGTWADSMADFMWHYEGVVEGSKLVLSAEGPHPTDPGKTVKARDTWEFKGTNTLIITGEMQGPDGTWKKMMSATCKRK